MQEELDDLMNKWRAEFGDDEDKTALVRLFHITCANI